MPKILPTIKGEKHGKLLILGLSPHTKDKARCVAQCECGVIKTYRVDMLRTGNTSSCGCVQRAHAVASGKTLKLDHGMSDTPEHRAWMKMRERCQHSHGKFARWGGRGIRVCDEWQTNFKAFYEHIGPRPGKGYSVDRIDNDRGYEPGNVRWGTHEQQARNRENSMWVEAMGQSKPIAQWAEETGLRANLIRWRIRKGWDPVKAVTTPARKMKNNRGRPSAA